MFGEKEKISVYLGGDHAAFEAKGKGTDILPSRSRGLYWLWCKTPLEQLKETKSNGSP